MLSHHLLPLCTVSESIVIILSLMCIVPKFIIDWFMILVSLVLKLFVSSRPLKLEGVLCIYVLLFHEGQAENHLICFSIWFEHPVWLSLFHFSWSFVCVSFHVITWLLNVFYQDYVFQDHVLSSLISALNAYFDDQDCDGACWYVSNVSIIFDAPCMFLHHFLSVLLHFVTLLCIFWN
jgi:hypothetical protein